MTWTSADFRQFSIVPITGTQHWESEVQAVPYDVKKKSQRSTGIRKFIYEIQPTQLRIQPPSEFQVLSNSNFTIYFGSPLLIYRCYIIPCVFYLDLFYIYHHCSATGALATGQGRT